MVAIAGLALTLFLIIAVTVMYEPPEHKGLPLSLSEASTIVDETLDQQEIKLSISPCCMLKVSSQGQP